MSNMQIAVWLRWKTGTDSGGIWLAAWRLALLTGCSWVAGPAPSGVSASCQVVFDNLTQKVAGLGQASLVIGGKIHDSILDGRSSKSAAAALRLWVKQTFDADERTTLMKFSHRIGAALWALAIGAAGSAQAHDVLNWSIGISSPGVSIGVVSAPPLFYPPPVYAPAYPVVVAPRPIYYVAPTYYAAPHWRPAHFAHPGHPYAFGHRNSHRDSHRDSQGGGHRGGHRGHF